MKRFAIIGGTGVDSLPPEWGTESLTIETSHGSADVVIARKEDEELIFLIRHGKEHKIPPHMINYRANTMALLQLGVTDVLATNAVGSLRADLPPGSLILLSDFIDYTRTRQRSFFTDDIVRHTDMSEPYSEKLGAALLKSASELNIHLYGGGVYICVEGPRYESPAEVRLFAGWGADVVGMTGLPEASMAREAGLRYAGVAIVTNLACGLTDKTLNHGDVTREMKKCMGTVVSLLLSTAGEKRER